MTQNVYHVEIDYDNIKGYPQVDYSIPANARYDWLKIEEMMDGVIPMNIEAIRTVNIAVKSTVKFDVLHFSSHLLLSPRGTLYFQSLNLQGVDFAPIMVNEVQFSAMIVRNVIDCFDKAHSTPVYFTSNPSKIMEITKYVFRKHVIPEVSLFRIPETNLIFATKALRDDIVHKSGLIGFAFIDWENPPPDRKVY